jgi:hypothetical protein
MEIARFSFEPDFEFRGSEYSKCEEFLRFAELEIDFNQVESVYSTFLAKKPPSSTTATTANTNNNQSKPTAPAMPNYHTPRIPAESVKTVGQPAEKPYIDRASYIVYEFEGTRILATSRGQVVVSNKNNLNASFSKSRCYDGIAKELIMTHQEFTDNEIAAFINSYCPENGEKYKSFEQMGEFQGTKTGNIIHCKSTQFEFKVLSLEYVIIQMGSKSQLLRFTNYLELENIQTLLNSSDFDVVRIISPSNSQSQRNPRSHPNLIRYPYTSLPDIEGNNISFQSMADHINKNCPEFSKSEKFRSFLSWALNLNVGYYDKSGFDLNCYFETFHVKYSGTHIMYTKGDTTDTESSVRMVFIRYSLIEEINKQLKLGISNSK